jgi:hypothetical protein
MTELKLLPPPEKKVVAKQLILNGFSSRQVQEILEIDHQTALNYANMPTPAEQEEFSTIFANYIKSQKQKGINLVYKRILELVPKERRIDQVVKAGEFLEGKQQGNQVNVLNQGDMSIEFI